MKTVCELTHNHILNMLKYGRHKGRKERREGGMEEKKYNIKSVHKDKYTYGFLFLSALASLYK